MTVNEQKVHRHFNIAKKFAIKEVELLARKVLTANEELSEFVMSRGHWGFKLPSGEGAYICWKGNYNHDDDVRLKYQYMDEFADFMEEWDRTFHLSESIMNIVVKRSKVSQDHLQTG